jgi:hypothetical protein
MGDWLKFQPISNSTGPRGAQTARPAQQDNVDLFFVSFSIEFFYNSIVTRQTSEASEGVTTQCCTYTYIHAQTHAYSYMHRHTEKARGSSMFDAVTTFARICAYGLLQLRVRERPLEAPGGRKGGD